MFALFLFGTYLERFISYKEYIILFLISGIFGNIGYMLTTPEINLPVVGASGSIYGIMGCLAALRPFAVIYIYFTPIPLVLAAVLWAITELLGIFTPSYIAHGSHLFGLLFGVFFGLYMKKRLSSIKYKFYM
jgi:membrane associated rhomboid family serine protease